MTRVPPEEGQPLARLPNRTPVLFSTLGAILHLELLGPDDEERLDQVNDLVWQWIGEHLRHTSFSFAPYFEPARREHLDYIAAYPTHLRVPPPRDPSSFTVRSARNLVKLVRDDYGVDLHGGAGQDDASPFSYHFWVEIGDVARGNALLPAYGVLHLTVPDTWPIQDFYEQVAAIVARLRLRWGAAGFTYASMETQNYALPAQRRFAHAQRFTGYDVAEYVRLVEPFYARLRTINWLTFLGGALADELRAAGGTLTSTPDVPIRTQGDTVLICAGPRPAAGDINRLAVPAAYRQADRLVRPIRAANGKDLIFLGPWDEATITRWLCRFELQVS